MRTVFYEAYTSRKAVHLPFLQNQVSNTSALQISQYVTLLKRWKNLKALTCVCKCESFLNKARLLH